MNMKRWMKIPSNYYWALDIHLVFKIKNYLPSLISRIWMQNCLQFIIAKG